MYNKVIYFFVIICLTKASCKLFKSSITNIPDYDFQKASETNLRNTFLEKRKQNRVSEKRMKILDKHIFNNAVYLDGIAHYESTKTNFKLKRINEIENEFKSIIGMIGVKYLYKRDAYWRTWREVKYANDTKKLVFYKFNNFVKLDCSRCQGGGYWNIEDKPPPCPFEIFSIINEDMMCVFNHILFHDKNMISSCPSKIKFADLSETCDNPIETKWIISRDYKSVSERYPTIICNGRENCEMTTVYAITPEQVSFRIINSSNDVIYSKVMKNGGKNYACVYECGQINPDSKKIIQQVKPLTFNLFSFKPRKNKRDNYFGNEFFLPLNITYPNEDQLKNNTIKNNNGGNLIEKSLDKPLSKGVHRNLMDHEFIFQSELETTTMSHCRKLEIVENKDLEDNETSDYDLEDAI